MRLAIITTHPIQYYAPVFKIMAQHINLKVFYTWGEASASKYDPDFGKTIRWDIDLLTGYDYLWVKNTATNPGSHHFRGIVNPDLIGQIQTWQPDAILVYGWAYQSHLKVMRHFKNKVPMLFRGDSTLLDEKPGIKNMLRYAWLTWVYRHIDYAFYTGLNNKAYFKKYGLTDEQLIFAPHAIDNSRFAEKKSSEVLKFKQRLNINEDDTLVLFAGKLEQKKDPLLLLKAFVTLKPANAHLLFVGNGMLEPQLKQQAKTNNIYFIDFQNQSYMPVIYQTCDIFCLPSKGPDETWGLAVNEAMACEKAVLTSDKTGCSADLIKPGVNGYVFKAGSVEDLSEKLHNLLIKNKPQLAAMGKNSGTIINEWNFNVQAHQIINYKKNEPRQ